MVHWLRLHASTAGGVSSIPGLGSSACHVTQSPKKKTRVLLQLAFLHIFYDVHAMSMQQFMYIIYK